MPSAVRVPERESLKQAVGIPMSSFLEGNRARGAEKKGEKQDQKDHFLTQDARSVELFIRGVSKSIS